MEIFVTQKKVKVLAIYTEAHVCMPLVCDIL